MLAKTKMSSIKIVVSAVKVFHDCTAPTFQTGKPLLPTVS